MDAVSMSKRTAIAAAALGLACYATRPTADDAASDDTCPFWECEQMPIPAGPFIAGSDDLDATPLERPAFEVHLSPYLVDRFEVSVRRYRLCVERGGCLWPQHCFADLEFPLPTEEDLLPMECADYHEASAYCAWIGRRLPTEMEWEKAARGGCEVEGPPTCGPEDHERRYSWGPWEPTCETMPKVKACGACFGWCPQLDLLGLRAFPVGAEPKDVSPYGVEDLSGNVPERVFDDVVGDREVRCGVPCVDPRWPPEGSGACRKGGWVGSRPGSARVYSRGSWTMDDGHSTHGFRCAADVVPPAGE